MRFQSLDLNMGDNYVDKHRLTKVFFLLLTGLDFIHIQRVWHLNNRFEEFNGFCDSITND